MSQKINLTKHIIAAGLLLFSAAAFVSCEKYVYEKPKIDLTIPVSFQDEILPLFSQCTGCHSGSRDFDARIEKAYTSIIEKNLVNTSAPESSKFITTINSTGHPQLLSDTEKQKILAWISQGALNN